MRKRTSLKDIANRVGVSVALVSYVLNGRNLDRINKDTASTIRKVAKEMNYQPNRIAQSLQSARTQTIGLIVADIANPYSSHIAQIIQEEAERRGYSTIFASAYESVERAENLMRVFMERQVDGIIIAPPANFEEVLREFQKLSTPIVLVDRYFPGLDADAVYVDDFQASYEATCHLINNGFESIGIINYDTSLYHLNERTRGYKKAVADAGLDVDGQNIQEILEEELEEGLQKAMKNLLLRKDPVEALFFTSSKIANAGLTYLNQAVIENKESLGIVCFDKTEAYGLFPRSLTYIEQPLKQIGKSSMDLLIDYIEEKDHNMRQIVLSTTLIVGESSLKTTLL